MERHRATEVRRRCSSVRVCTMQQERRDRRADFGGTGEVPGSTPPLERSTVPRTEQRFLRRAQRTIVAAALLSICSTLVAIAIGTLLHNGGASVVWNGWLGLPHVVNGTIEHWPPRGFVPEHPSEQIAFVTVSRGDWGITRYGLYSSRAMAEQTRFARANDLQTQRVPRWARRRWLHPRPDIISVTGYGWPWPAVISWRSPKLLPELLPAVGPITPDEEASVWPGTVDEYIDTVALQAAAMVPFETGRQRVLYWPGIALDAAVFGGSVMALWMVARRTTRTIVVRTRTRRGLCVNCGYARVGLRYAGPCPECGHTQAAAVRTN